MKKKYPAANRFVSLLMLAASLLPCHAMEKDEKGATEARGGRDYEWTTDHMQFGVRWQPFAGFPENNAYDAKRPVIAEDSGYAQFWVNWSAVEPEEKNTDYSHHMSPELQAIEQAVDACVARGLKVELVFWHCPGWASASGQAGGWKPKPDEFKKFATRMAQHFKNRVDAYQLYHEANQKAMMQDGNIDEMMSEIFVKGAQAIRKVYNEAPARPVLLSTSGISPCDACPALGGLKGRGAEAALDFYDRLIANKKLMGLVDGLNMNVSDHYDGYGSMDGSRIPSVWANYDILRRKLDAAGYRNKKILASESWVVWDNAPSAVDATGDGVVNEQDAYAKTITILGRCVERGLNTINLPWSDNSSGWAMGLTKRRDYNGGIKKLQPDLVIPARDGGADIVTQKVELTGTDSAFQINKGSGTLFTGENYIDPSNPNHLHYYIWRWYAQIAGGTDQVIRHALAGEDGNDIGVVGLGFTGSERYRIASYNRTQEKFTVLLYASGATGKSWAVVKIPAKIQNGAVYNNKYSKTDFRGEGFEDGEHYDVRIETKDIDKTTGSDVDVRILNKPGLIVKNGTLEAPIETLNKFTTITFTRSKSAEAQPAAPARPNIILVMPDDLGYGDYSSLGAPIVRTPAVDAFKKQSVLFTQFHVSPSCSPTRAALLTGRHEFKNGVTHTIIERERLSLNSVTLPQMLKSAGYTTGIFGKWHLGDEAEHRPENRGFDEVFIHGGGGIGQTYPGSCGDAPGNTNIDPTLWHNGLFEKTKGFCTDVFFNQAEAWIDAQRKEGKPFFALITPNAAHTPLVVPEEYYRQYLGLPGVSNDVAKFYGMIENIDTNFGKLMAKLEEWKIADNTLVIYIGSDNGGFGPACQIFNAGMRGSKLTPYQGGTRVPAFWRWPAAGIAGGTECDALAAHIDIFPTLAAISGAELSPSAKNQVDGQNLLALLKNPKAERPERTLIHHIGRWEKGRAADAKYSGCSIQNSQYTLVNNTELYDLKNDPGETTNIIAEHPEVAEALRAEYDQWWGKLDPYLVNENAIAPKFNPMKEIYWKQFGVAPSEEDLKNMNPALLKAH